MQSFFVWCDNLKSRQIPRCIEILQLYKQITMNERMQFVGRRAPIVKIIRYCAFSCNYESGEVLNIYVVVKDGQAT